MKNKLHFWYSEKQALYMREFKEILGICVIDGVEHIFTQSTPTKNKESIWDDCVYLGEGTIVENYFKEEKHFWYSEKQALCYARISENKYVNRCIIDGMEHVYTECNSTGSTTSKWDDMKYLGKGRIYYRGPREVWVLANKFNI